MSDEGMRIFYNAVLMACFTALAIAFGHWWLIFLAILFWGMRE